MNLCYSKKLCLPPILSFVSALLIISASPIAFPPASPIAHSCVCIWITNEQNVDWYHLCFLERIFTIQVEVQKCCVWFQCFTQWCCSGVSNHVPCCCEENRKKVNCWWMSFVCLLSFAFTFQFEYRECCVWFQWFTQWRCSFVSNLIYGYSNVIKTLPRISREKTDHILTCQIEFFPGNDVHHKCSTLNRESFLYTPCRYNTKIGFHLSS